MVNKHWNKKNKILRNFRNNECNIIICNIAINEGIDLHDLYGIPRVSIISPPFSKYTISSSMARIHRAGSKTPALHRLIYCAGTCEEVICNRLKEKLKFMAKLNDNDLKFQNRLILYILIFLFTYNIDMKGINNQACIGPCYSKDSIIVHPIYLKHI